MPAPPDNADTADTYDGIDRELRPTSFLEYLTDPDAPASGGGAIDGTANLAGTVCERALVALYEGRIGRSLTADSIRNSLTEAGHAKSTIGRALTNLVKHHVLTNRPDGLVYTGASLPIPKKSFSKAGDNKATNRFGGRGSGRNRVARELSQEAKLVQAVLVDRFDEIFEQPSSMLAACCRLMVAADRMARAVESGLMREAKRQAEHIRELTDEINGDAQRRRLDKEPLSQPLGPNHIYDAIASSLFPAEYEDDPVFAAQIAEQAKRQREANMAMNLHIAAENSRVLAANEKIDRENVERRALGLKPLEREEVKELLTEKWSVDGLVVGDRLGEARMAAFVEWYKGQTPGTGDWSE